MPAAIQSAAYPATICAERSAITHAVAEGRRKFVAIAVATANEQDALRTCRQVMSELSPESNLIVIIVDPKRIAAECRAGRPIPDSFGPEQLKK